MSPTYTGFQFTVFVSQPLLLRVGNSLRVIPNGTFKLYRKGTQTPATIYTDDHFTIGNTTGLVTAGDNGVWGCYLDPTYSPYEVEYKGNRYDVIDVPASRREAEQDLASFAEKYGLGSINPGDQVALRSWVEQQVANFTEDGLNQAAVQGLINTALANFEVSGGVSEAAVQTLINQALAAYVPSVNIPSVTDFARIRGDVANRDVIVSQTLPTGTTNADWLSANAYVNVNGKVLFRQAVAGQTPETQAPPTTSQPLGWLDEAHKHFKGAYLNNGIVAVSNVVSITDVARSLEQAAIAVDRTSFDLIFSWLQTNMKRTGQPDPKDLYGTSFSTTSATVTDWTVDTGACLDIFGALVSMWNTYSAAEYRDAASKIFSDLVNYCAIADEGRLFLAIDQNQKLVTNGHHLHPSNGGAVSAHAPGKINPLHLKAAKTFFGSTVCDQLLDGYYALLSKLNAGGLPPDYCSYNTASHAVGTVANGTDGWTVSLSHDFGLIAQRIGPNIALDRSAFNETRGVSTISALKVHYAAKWGAQSAIYTVYNLAGASQNTTQATEVALAAIDVLLSSDPSNAIAAAIRSAKIPTSQGFDSFGYYVPNQIKGVTPASSLLANQLAFIAYSKDNGKWADLTKLGATPNAGTLYPPGSSNTGSGTSTPPVVVVPPTGDTGVGQPVGSYKLYVDTNASRFLALNWAQSLPSGTTQQQTWKTRALNFTKLNAGQWIGDWDENASGTKLYIDDAEAAGAIATVLSYRIPGRDLGQYSAGGAANRAAYEAFINNLCTAIGQRKVVLCLEPDSLPHMVAMPEDQRAGRISIMDWAIRTIRSKCPNCWVYVDAGHSNWVSASQTADLLRAIHIENAHGIATNVSNFRPDAEIIAWSQQVLDNLNISHLQFVYDCGRNGNNTPPQDSDFPSGDPNRFANPRGRQLGQLPQFGGMGIRKCAGRLWWKKPGESDGNNGDGAPNAGELFSLQLLNTAVGDRVNGSTNATSSGYLQRPGGNTGVANG